MSQWMQWLRRTFTTFGMVLFTLVIMGWIAGLILGIHYAYELMRFRGLL